MTIELKQSTAATVNIGPFLDSSDLSAETGLTLTQANVRLSKNGGDMAQKNNAATCNHDESGYYSCSLSATDTNTLGSLKLMVSPAGVMPVFHEYMIVAANYYNTKYGSDSLDVNLNADQTVSLAADQTHVTVGTVNNLTGKTGFSLSSSGIDAFFDEALSGHTTVGTAGYTLAAIRKFLSNKRNIIGTTETVFEDNGTNTFWQWTLDSDTPPITSKTPV